MQSGKQRDQMVYRDLNECEDSRIFDVENMTEEERRILDKHSSRLMKETGAALLVGICIGAATWRQVNVWSGATLRNSPKFHKRLRFWMLPGLLSIPPSVTFLWRLAEHFNQMSDEFPPGGHAIASLVKAQQLLTGTVPDVALELEEELQENNVLAVPMPEKPE